MNTDAFLTYFDQLIPAPDSIPRLRELVLDLAVRGKLVDQDAADESLGEYLNEAKEKLKEQAAATPRLRWKPSAPIEPEEFEGDVPSGWTAVRLNDTGLYVNGLAFKPSDWQDSGLPIIRIQNLTDPSKKFNYASGNYHDAVSVHDGDILVSWSATLDAFVWQGDDGVLNQHIFKVLPADELTDRKFLHLLLRHAIKELGASKHAHGLVMTHINREPFLSHVVLLPPLAEQHRIVAKVDELMTLCDKLEAAEQEQAKTRTQFTAATHARLTDPTRAPEDFQTHATFTLKNLDALTTHPTQLKTLRETILTLAVQGKLVPQNPTDEPASELAQRIKKARSKVSNLKKKAAKSAPMTFVPFEIPESWSWEALGEIFEYDAGRKQVAENLEEDRWLLELEDVEKTTGKLLARRKVAERESKSTKSEFRDGDILYGKLRPNLNKVLVADEAGYSTTEIVSIRPYIPLCSEFCALVLRSPYFVTYATSFSQGTKMPRLRTQDALAAPFPLPPLTEQRRIVVRIGKVMSLFDELEKAHTRQDEAVIRLAKASHELASYE